MNTQNASQRVTTATATERSVGSVSLTWLAVIAGVIVILDQTTKAAVIAMLPLHRSVEIIKGFLDFTHVHNTGAAFGLLNDVDIMFKPAIMAAVAFIALIAIMVYGMKTVGDEPMARVGLSLVLGGATGNLIDRITTGYVVDFIDVYWRSWHFWAFNVADAAITVGAGLLILDMIFLNRHVSTTA